MTRLQILTVLLVAGLLLPACGSSSSGQTNKKEDPVWMPPEQAKPAKEDVQPPTAEPASVAAFVTEWQELGLTEDQIKFKLTDGLKNGHLPAISKATAEELAAIRTAGGSDGLIEFLGELDLPEELPATTDTEAPGDTGQMKPPLDTPEAAQEPGDTGGPMMPPLDSPEAAQEPPPAGS